MHGRKYLAASLFLGIAASITLACGSSSPHDLQSISVSPSSADAQNFPNGQVQFTAAGAYNTPPMTVTLTDATWGAAFQGGSTTAVTVDASGVAQCAPGAAGVYDVGAWDVMHTNGPTCTATGPFGEPACNAVLGTAQLTCP
jgi:hypothetical protein